MKHITRPQFQSVPLTAGLKWPGGAGWRVEEKMDGVWAVREFGRSFVCGEAMKDGRFIAFDLPIFEGQDLRREPLRTRLALLDGLNLHRPAVGNGGEFLEAVLSRGGEGVVAKHLDGTWADTWLKCKRVSKGNQSGKEAVDRISGSGVFARDPDAILTFTRHKEDGAFVVDSTLRNCSTVKPFVVQWGYPLMRRADNLDPAQLKLPSKGGRPQSHTVQMILDSLGKKCLKPGELQKLCDREHGMSRSVFFKLKKQAEKSGSISRNAKGKLSVSKVSQPNSDTSDTR